MRRFGAIEAKIQEIHGIQTKVITRSEELQATSLQNEHTHQVAKQALIDLREQMRKSSESFELENRGLHAVSERVADLRNAVKECEARFAMLDAASQGAAAVQAQVRALGEQSTQLSTELSQITEDTNRLAALRQDVERIGAVTEDVTSRMDRINQLKPDVDDAMQSLIALKGAHELVADGLERMRVAYEEMTRLRESHADVQGRLSTSDAWIRKVEAETKELAAMEPEVARIRDEIEQVKGAMAEIAARRESVAEIGKRIDEVGSTGMTLAERMKGLESRIDGADSRFVRLAKKSDQAEQVAEMINGVVESVAEADRRAGAVDASVRALENRTSQLDEIEGRIRMLGQELEQRRGALDKASEHLTQATQLRKQSAETAHRLEEVSRTISCRAHRRGGAVGQTGAHRRRSRRPRLGAQGDRAPCGALRGAAGQLGVGPGGGGSWAGADLGPSGRGRCPRGSGEACVRAGRARRRRRPDHRIIAPRDRGNPRSARDARVSRSRRPKARWRSSRPGSVSWSAPSSGSLAPKPSRSACARRSRLSPRSAPLWITRWSRRATSRCR